MQNTNLTQTYYNVMKRELADIESTITKKPMYTTSVDKHLKAIESRLSINNVRNMRKILHNRAEQLVSNTPNSADIEIGQYIAKYIAVTATIGLLPFHKQNVVNRQHWLPLAMCKHFNGDAKAHFFLPALIQYRNGETYRMTTDDKQFILPGSDRHNRQLEEALAFADSKYALSFRSHLVAGAMFIINQVRNPCLGDTPKTIKDFIEECAKFMGYIGRMYVVREHV